MTKINTLLCVVIWIFKSMSAHKCLPFMHNTQYLNKINCFPLKKNAFLSILKEDICLKIFILCILFNRIEYFSTELQELFMWHSMVWWNNFHYSCMLIWTKKYLNPPWLSIVIIPLDSPKTEAIMNSTSQSPSSGVQNSQNMTSHTTSTTRENMITGLDTNFTKRLLARDTST